jgi:hypothetical protein
VVVAEDAESTLALLSDLRGTVRIHGRAGGSWMRLGQGRIGPVTIDRTIFACRWGFSSPSRFAVYYRHAYGVLPVHTLRT